MGSPQDTTLLAGTLVALAVQRALELPLSRRNVSRAEARRGAPLRPETAAWDAPLLYALHVAFFAGPAVEAALRGGVHPRIPWAVGWGVLLACQVVRLWTMRVLGDQWRIPPIVFPGELRVTRGPYAWLRHPNLAIVVVEFAAVPLLAGTPTSGAALFIVNLFVVLRRARVEERAFQRLSGSRSGLRAAVTPC